MKTHLKPIRNADDAAQLDTADKINDHLLDLSIAVHKDEWSASVTRRARDRPLSFRRELSAVKADVVPITGGRRKELEVLS